MCPPHIEGVISDYEKGNYGDKFITVEKKQIRVPNPKFLNSEIQTEPKPVRGRDKKSCKEKQLIMEHQKLSIFVLNCCSITNKLGEIKLMLYTRMPDIFSFTETWISRFEPKFNDYLCCNLET